MDEADFAFPNNTPGASEATAVHLIKLLLSTRDVMNAAFVDVKCVQMALFIIVRRRAQETRMGWALRDRAAGMTRRTKQVRGTRNQRVGAAAVRVPRSLFDAERPGAAEYCPGPMQHTRSATHQTRSHGPSMIWTPSTASWSESCQAALP